MREIKFRVWNLRISMSEGYDNKMSYFDLYQLDEDYVISAKGYLDKNSIIMQSTEFKDDTGKEIYEGDILDFGIWGDTENAERGVVEYSSMMGAYIVNYYSPYGGEGFDLLKNEESPIEVIGNIYENPELLKGGK